MELPFYLRILPPEALEVLAYYRRLGHNIAYANAMMAATGLSERGFGKAIRRLVTKGYLVLDGDQRYRLTEHGQRAVDDLPASMAAPMENERETPDIEHVPIDDTDTFESLFNDSSDIDSLFDEPVSERRVDASSFLTEESFADDPDALSRLFDSAESEEDDLFAELNDEDAAAFDEFFGAAETTAEPASPAPPPTPANQPAVEAVAPEDLFAGMDEALPAAVVPESDEDEPLPLPQADSASDDLFEWLEMDDDSVSNEGAVVWDDLTSLSVTAPPSETQAESRIVERRLVLALPQPLVAEQPARITIGILPGEDAVLAEPVSLMVRLAVVNGEPARAQDLPMLLTNGLTRQDVMITPGRYQQVRVRVRVYQVSDADDEAILCGGLYVDADVVEAADSQPTPVAFGADTHFVLSV